MKRCLDKRNRMSRSGSAAHTLPKCKCFDSLLFLNDKISNRETSSNIILPTHDSNGDPEAADTSANDSLPCLPALSSSVPSPASAPLYSTPPPSSSNASSSTTVNSASQLTQSSKRKSLASTGISNAKLRKKDDMSSRLDLLTFKLLENEAAETSNNRNHVDDHEEDVDLLFFKSLLPAMHALSKKKNRQARKKIQDIIFDLEISDED